MTVKLQWYARQMALALLSYLVCISTICIFVPCLVKIYHFMNIGFDMWPGYKWPKNVSITYSLQMLWGLSLFPILKYLPLTFVADECLRRFVYRLYD